MQRLISAERGLQREAQERDEKLISSTSEFLEIMQREGQAVPRGTTSLAHVLCPGLSLSENVSDQEMTEKAKVNSLFCKALC